MSHNDQLTSTRLAQLFERQAVHGMTGQPQPRDMPAEGTVPSAQRVARLARTRTSEPAAMASH